MNSEKQSLVSYLDQKGNVDLPEVLICVIEIGKLMMKLHQEGYILGAVELEDFILVKEDIWTLQLREQHFLFEKGKMPPNTYQSGSLSAVCIRNKRYSQISELSDIELLGKIFMKLMLPKRAIENYKELRYLAYNLGLFYERLPWQLYHWIDRITTIYPTQQFENVKEAVDDLKNIYHSLQQPIVGGSSQPLTYFYSCISHPGRGKITKLTKQKLTSIEWINQDVVGTYEESDRLFAFVADGVSHSTYGTGYEASHIIKEVCDAIVKDQLGCIEPDSVEAFYNTMLRQANERIYQAAYKYASQEQECLEGGDIMASTFVGCVLIGEKAYIASIGDSRGFLYREGRLVPLTVEENLGNQCLIEEITWAEYMALEKPDALTRYIGGIQDLTVKINTLEVRRGDTLLLCSDGLTDHFNDLGKKDDVWNMNENIEKILHQIDSKNVGQINARLVDRANYNGGWDNISSLLITIK